jgi:SAM-dependent methyltransferase
MLEAAKLRIAERGGAPNCTFVEANAYNIAEVVPRIVDYVFLANAFHGVPDKPRLARAVHDILKPGGLFAVVSWYARPRETTTVLGEPRGPATELRMTPEQTVASVEPGCLRLRNRIDVSPYHYGAVFERPR